MLQKFATLMISQALSSISSPYGTIGFKVFPQKSSRLRGISGSVLSMNVIETFKNTLRPVLEKYLKRCFCMKTLERWNFGIVFVIVFVTYLARFLPIKSHGSCGLMRSMANSNHYISTTILPLATKIGKMMTFLDLFNPLITWKQLYLHHHKFYGYRAWQYCDLL